jgi:general secretion pathway protein G
MMSLARRPAEQYLNHTDAGYTLLEVLVVKRILAFLTAFMTPQLMGCFGEAKAQSVQWQFENSIGALELRHMQNDVYSIVSNELKTVVKAAPESALGSTVSQESKRA